MLDIRQIYVIWPDIQLFDRISGYLAGYPVIRPDIRLFGQISGNLSYNDYLSLEINRISGIQPKKYRINPIIYICNCFFFTVKFLIDPGNVSVITTKIKLEDQPFSQVPKSPLGALPLESTMEKLFL